MKHILYLLLFGCMIVAACSKNSDSPPGTYIRYKIHGKPVEIRGEFNRASETGVAAGRFDKERNGFQNTFYKIQGRGATDDLITLYIPVDSLETKTYHLDTALYFASSQGGVDVIHNDSLYTLLRGSDYTHISISSYSQGTISGTFQGTFSRYHLATNSYTQAVVSEGSFQNVKIVYQ